uniref:Lipoprotein n=1 Tax=Pseudomonas phage RVTF4 TaxID=3236931 RepID=A0AB39CCF5_9VIRU
MKTKLFALVVIAATLVGCNQPVTPAPKVEKPKERNEVIARRAALEVKLTDDRSQWANDCMKKKEVEMMFESDRAARCLMFSKEIYPDNITQKLLAEFGGDLVVHLPEEVKHGE